MSRMSSIALAKQLSKETATEAARDATEHTPEDLLMANGLNVTEEARRRVQKGSHACYGHSGLT